MALTEEQIEALEADGITDLLVAGQAGWRVYRPSLSYTTIAQIENVIAEAGLQQEYTVNLKQVVQGLPGTLDWKLVTATPLQKCKAYLRLFVE